LASIGWINVEPAPFNENVADAVPATVPITSAAATPARASLAARFFICECLLIDSL
jgi:hypothetical protein